MIVNSLLLDLQENPSIAAMEEFLANDPASIWFIEKGGVDLYVCRLSSDDNLGARKHLMRLNEGQIFCGFPSNDSALRILAKPLPQTLLRRSSAGNFFSASERNDDAERTLLLEGWIDSLTLIVCDPFLTGPAIPVTAGDQVLVPPPTRVIRPVDGLLWLSHTTGSSFFRDAYFQDGEIPLISGPACFPITRNAWLQAAPGAAISVANTACACSSEPTLPGLELFHKIILSFLANRRKKEEGQLITLAAERNGADAAVLNSALIGLSSPLRRMGQRTRMERVCRDPHFETAALVGNALGLTLTAPREMLERKILSNPLDAIAHTSNVRTRVVALEGRWWERNHGPLVASSGKERRPQALLWRWRRYVSIDPAAGTSTRVNAANASTLNPFASSLYRPLPSGSLTFMNLLSHASAESAQELVVILLVGLATGLTALITPAAIKSIFDQLIPGAERGALLQLCGLLIVASGATALLFYVRGLTVLRLEGKIDASLQAAIWDRLLHLPATFFRQYTAGDLTERCLAVTAMRNVITTTTVSGLLSGIFSIFSYVQLFYYSVSMACVATGLVAIAFTVTTICGLYQVRFQRKLIGQNGRIAGLVLQFLSGIAKLRVAGVESRAFSRWAQEFSMKKCTAVKSRHISNLLTIFLSTFPLLSTATLFFCYTVFVHASVPGVSAGALTTGSFMAFFAAFVQFLTSLMFFSGALVGAASVVPLYERVKPILTTAVEAGSVAGDQHVITGALEVNHVSFRYEPDGPEILSDVSISVAAGEFVAIVGASGSGKSTLLRLLLGFEAPAQGAIFYDNRDLSGLDLTYFRRQSGVVLQASSLQTGSIFENLAGSFSLTHDGAWKALRLASLEDDVRAMPMGLNTVITSAGGGLSGGQRQRLLIAKALARRPRILFFDEATSALDNATQARVTQGLERQRVTRIVIAHRLSTIQNADRIYVLERGRLVQTGTNRELLDEEGAFRELAYRQLL